MKVARLRPILLPALLLSGVCAGCALEPYELTKTAQPVAGQLPAAGPELACDSVRITLSGLLNEMVDLGCLAKLPVVPFTSRLSSSHNRRSDHAAPTHPDWFASADAIALSTTEPATLLDVRGPGVLTRFWSANPRGTLAIYLDGGATPAVELDMRQLMSGQTAPFRAPFAFVAGAGWNLYFPIPFATGCRVTLDSPSSGAPLYYQIDYRQYPTRTRVESFGAESLRAASRVLPEVSAKLARAPFAPTTTPTDRRHHFELDSSDPNRRSATLTATGAGGGILRELRITPRGMDPRVLRASMLSMRFDGMETVRVPLADFFASGVARSQVSAGPIAGDRSGFISRWPMPFAREAQLSVTSTGDGALPLELEVVSSDLPWTSRSLHFFAHWHAPETFASKPPHDWNLATLTGRGHYVGNVLNIINRNPSWWGEGDEKIYVDGETFPSHFGTGTEDYYGYAWCSNQRFTTPYIGQPLASPRQNFGYTSLYRFHILDVIPFQRSLRFDLEVAHWGPPVQVTYDAISFWYARPGAHARTASPDPTRFRIPELAMPTPTDIPEGPYQCGGDPRPLSSLPKPRMSPQL
jgi:hypothetical protein